MNHTIEWGEGDPPEVLARRVAVNDPLWLGAEKTVGYSLPGSYWVNLTLSNRHSDPMYGSVGENNTSELQVHVQLPVEQWSLDGTLLWVRQHGGKALIISF